MGNLNSVKKKILRLGANAIISSQKKDILNASKLILPGVGHFKKAMNSLRELDLIDCLNEAVIKKGTPVLGICLGMQLMATRSEEGDVAGLGWIEGEIVKFAVEDFLKFKVPHTGWNQIIKIKGSILMRNVPDLSELYFVHSYHWKSESKESVLNETEYEYKFASALEKNNIFGVQYHPEKSHDVGDIILENFIKI